MKKRLTAFLLVLSLLLSFTAAYADYYKPTVKGGESFSEIINFKTNYKEAYSNLKTALSMMENGEKADKIFAILDEYTEDFPVKCEQQLASLRASLDNSEENNTYYSEIYNLAVDSYDIINTIIKGMAESDKYRTKLLEWAQMTDEELSEYLDSIPTSREYELMKEINALTEQYYNSQESFPQLEGYDAYVSYLRGQTEKLGEIYVKLVNKRNELAKEEGYENYADYAYDEVYEKDYSASERQEFYRCTQKYISPILNKIALAYSAVKNSYTETRTDDEILADTREYLEKINPELTEAFDYMTEKNLVDMKSSDKKKNGCYTTYLDRFEVPFIFINPSGYDVQSTLIHEYGHYTAEFHEQPIGTLDSVREASNLDVAEIQSQGLEVLFYDFYGKLYGNSGKSEKIKSVYNLASSVVDAALYSEWQEAVYGTENLTVEKCNSLFKQYCVKYNVDSSYACDENGGYLWVIVNHNFEVPMYYISYGVSALAALELLSEAETDRASATDKYMRLSALGEYVDFKFALQECGFSSIFAESTFAAATDAILKICGMGYKDVDIKSNFFPYILLANDYMDSTGDSFIPDSPASRETFVSSIGKLEDDLSGIETVNSPFSDIDNKYVSWAAENKIAAGTENSRFDGLHPLTREQAVCFLYRFAGEPSVEDLGSEFKDSAEISDWAKSAVIWAEKIGIVSGYDDGCFYPQKSVTRAESAILVSMIYTNYSELKSAR